MPPPKLASWGIQLDGPSPRGTFPCIHSVQAACSAHLLLDRPRRAQSDLSVHAYIRQAPQNSEVLLLRVPPKSCRSTLPSAPPTALQKSNHGDNVESSRIIEKGTDTAVETILRLERDGRQTFRPPPSRNGMRRRWAYDQDRQQ